MSYTSSNQLSKHKQTLRKCHISNYTYIRNKLICVHKKQIKKERKITTVKPQNHAQTRASISIKSVTRLLTPDSTYNQQRTKCQADSLLVSADQQPQAHYSTTEWKWNSWILFGSRLKFTCAHSVVISVKKPSGRLWFHGFFKLDGI